MFTTESNAADGWAPVPWPGGPPAFEVYESLDATTVLTYSRWTTDGSAFLTGLTGATPTGYHLHREGDDGRTPGCVVAVEAEFDGPRPDRVRRWIDTVFEVMEGDKPHPGGISGRFHISLDGTRMLNLAGWTGAEAHEEAVADRNPAWQRVYDFPGVESGGFRRYAPIRPRADIEASPTGWVAGHVADLCGVGRPEGPHLPGQTGPPAHHDRPQVGPAPPHRPLLRHRRPPPPAGRLQRGLAGAPRLVSQPDRRPPCDRPGRPGRLHRPRPHRHPRGETGPVAHDDRGLLLSTPPTRPSPPRPAPGDPGQDGPRLGS